MNRARLVITAPATPGSTPSEVGSADTLKQARKIAREFSRGRKDLCGQDVRIELRGGKLIEYAGVGR